MKRFEMRVDPVTQEIYYEVPLTGRSLLNDPFLNKGQTFTAQERSEFNLIGLIPDTYGTLEGQIDRNYDSIRMKSTDLEKYMALMELRDRNETVFYALITRHIEEFLPIIYTPTVGQACLKMSHIIRRFRGVYVSPGNISHVENILTNPGMPSIGLIVVTDGERILGLGDLGADGMGIPIGKTALYIAAAGIHPSATMPICLDVGTNNERLLKDPLYIGIRQPRLTGDAYLEVVERFIQGIRRIFPRALLQWEDFGKDHAFDLLERYRDRILSFNDDIQGTGAVAASALLTAVRISGKPFSEHRICIHGFGQAGSGVAKSIVTMMQEEGKLSLQEARSRIFAIDINGLLMQGDKAEPYQKDFLQPRDIAASWSIGKNKAPKLADVVKHGKISILIGLSAQPGVFNEPLLADMMANTDRPIIFALSNPTSKCEATPETVMKATNGRALMATGSPFAPVKSSDGREIHVSQCNNLYVFPGMGLGAIVCQASKITQGMFHAASQAISKMVTVEMQQKGCVLPSLTDVRHASFEVALAVARQAREDGIGMIASDEHLTELIKDAMWEPHYYTYRHGHI
jgi:malate dehydrogenase (oxaloacetate-decarboxylating)